MLILQSESMSCPRFDLITPYFSQPGSPTCSPYWQQPTINLHNLVLSPFSYQLFSQSHQVPTFQNSLGTTQDPNTFSGPIYTEVFQNLSRSTTHGIDFPIISSKSQLFHAQSVLQSAGPKEKSCIKPRKKYLKKNAQSNVSNQALSFLICRAKSQEILQRVVSLPEKEQAVICNLYYSYAKFACRDKKKYVSKKTLVDLSFGRICHFQKDLEENSVFDPRLSSAEFCRITRIMLKYYLTVICPLTILRSKRLSKDTRLQNLEKRRDILRHLMMAV